MANQPKKYKKFVATAATATLVASAIVPVASAAPTDIDNSEFKEEILAAIELGLFQDNDKFNPKQSLKRGHVVSVLGRYLGQAGYEPAADYLTNPAFSDLSTDSDAEYLKNASIVKEAGVFTGSAGKINWNDNITRENMAIVLDRLAKEVTGISFTDLAAEIEDVEIADLEKANVNYRDAIQALRDLEISTATNFNPKGDVQRGHFAKFVVNALAVVETLLEEDEDGDNGDGGTTTEDTGNVTTPAITSVTALSKTTVQVNLNTAVDEVAKENFTIEGASVNGVELSEDKKTATLSVSGLAYSTKYTVAVKDVKVEGEAVDFGSKEFTTPAVTEDYTLKVTPAATVVTANGADNTVIKFELLGADGKVDANADNMVLELATTFGNLATNRVTVQDGVGQVVLSSEFSTKEVIAKVTAQIIEASTDYKDLIGKVPGEAFVTFSPSAATTDPNAVTFQDAESNQADRVVLYFDKEVSPATFVQTNDKGEFLTDSTKTEQLLKANVKIDISQNGTTKDVVGVISVPGNPKAVEVLLAKNTILTDNAKVNLDVTIGTTRNQRAFTLTDARQPEFTGVTPTNLRTLDLKFSESVVNGNFKIDGIWDGALSPDTSEEFTVKFGEFDAVTGVDKRDTAKVTLNKDVNGKQLYFKAGLHSITVTQLSDFAALSDNANVSTTQTLNFSVAADTTEPAATVKVESPEQFRVTFNKDVDATPGSNSDVDQMFNDAFQVYDEAAKEWTSLTNLKDANGANVFNLTTADLLKVDVIDNNTEFVAELTEDWTQVLAKSTDAYYNYKFRFKFGKESFISLTNGKVNSSDIILDLNAEGSPLNQADNASPTISDITQISNTTYEITMDEPIKLTEYVNGNAQSKDDAGLTLAKDQGLPQVVQAELQGKDKNGKAVVIPALVNTYSDKNGADMKFTITTTGDLANVSQLVSNGYSENWKVVVRSVADDIGNTAATLTKDFIVTPGTVVSSGFQIVSKENDPKGREGVIAKNSTSPSTPDVIEVEFTKGVNVAGPDNLTSVYNWTLNGTKLSNLSNVKGITVVDVDGNEDNGYEKVIITFADDRAFGAASNVISVTKGITSLDGTVLTGEYEVVAETIGQ